MNRRLRVAAVFVDLNIGGDENRTLSFIKSFDRSRMDYTVVTVCRPDGPQDNRLGPMRSRYAAEGIELLDLGEPPERPSVRDATQYRILELPNYVTRNVSNLTRRVARLSKILRQRRIDVIDAHMSSAILYAAMARKFSAVRGVVATEYGLSTWDRPVRRTLARAAFRQVDTLVTDSHMRCREMYEWLKNPALKTAVIPNGVYRPLTTETSASMRRKLDLPEDPQIRIIGQVSRLLPFKGHRPLLEAAKIVLDRHPQAAFLLCGFAPDPAYRASLQKLADDLGIAPRVRIVSYPGTIGDVWAAIDIHVHASLIESLPVAIAEGMSLGKPAVVAAAGGIPELVDDGKTGLIVPTGQPVPLAEALIRVLKEPDLARQLGEAALQRYEQMCKPEQMARSLEDLFHATAFGNANGKARHSMSPALGGAQ
jgi:glycosyltransferase involved in cell wall biosynthesis